MLYTIWLRIQLAFWLTVAWFEDRYRIWQLGREIKALEEKGLVVTRGKGRKMEFDLTPLGIEIGKLITTPNDIRG